jgi:hypothetical protein
MLKHVLDTLRTRGMINLKEHLSDAGHFALVPTSLELSRMSKMTTSRLNNDQILEICCTTCRSWEVYSTEFFSLTKNPKGVRMSRICRPCKLQYNREYRKL